jgi:hypothetical protein
MPSAYLEPVAHPSAWRGDDPALLTAITRRLPVEHRDRLGNLLDQLELESMPAHELTVDYADLEELEAWLAKARDEVIHGLGLVLIRGVPIEGHSLAAIERLYWILGTRFGSPVSQSVMGDRIGQVQDVSGKDPNERAYRNSLELPLHTDISDIVAMLSIRPAKEGGLSLYASVAAVHNHILQTRPELLEPLYRGYRMHLFGEQPPGMPPVTDHPVPVLSECGELISARIVPEYIDMAEVELGELMPALDREALDYFLAVAHDPQIRLSVMLEPGDLTFINNYAVLHARTLFNDFDDTAKARHLLRLWLKGDEVRPLDQSLLDVKRDGIAPQGGREHTYFDGETAAKAHRPFEATPGAASGATRGGSD